MDSRTKKAFQSSSQFNFFRISKKEDGKKRGELRLLLCVCYKVNVTKGLEKLSLITSHLDSCADDYSPVLFLLNSKNLVF